MEISRKAMLGIMGPPCIKALLDVSCNVWRKQDEFELKSWWDLALGRWSQASWGSVDFQRNIQE